MTTDTQGFKTVASFVDRNQADICAQAYEKGRREGIRVYEFLRGPLTDAFGQEFYSTLSAAAKMLIAAS